MTRLLPLLLLALTALPALALEVPPLRGRVNDLAGMISPDAERRLEGLLADLERSDSTQLAILTLPTLAGESLEDYALRVGETWGLGQKGFDNGVLLLVARDERRIRIEVGYGLEGTLTDLLAGRIIDQEIAPRFRQGDIDGGFLAGATAIAAAVRGEYTAATQRSDRERAPWGWLALLLFLGPGLTLLGGGPRRGSHHRRGGFWIGPGDFGGGGFRGGGGGFGGGFSGGGGGFGGGGASGGW